MRAVECSPAWLAPLLAVALACETAPPTAPRLDPDSATPGIAEVRISGVPVALTVGATAQLRVEVVLDNGAMRECEARWSVDDGRVASISPSGLLTAGMTGYVNIAASCDGRTARARMKIDGPNPYRLVIVAQDSEVPTVYGVGAMMEFLDGPRAGERIRTSWDFYDIPGVPWPVKVRFTADLYEPKEFILAESTGERRNSESPLFDFRIPMMFVGDALTDSYVRTMSAAEMQISHPFTLRTPGDVRIRTWWHVDYNDRLFIELWCGGRLLKSGVQLDGSQGAGFTHFVPASGDCEIRLRQSKSDADTHYRVAITYPR